MKRDFIPEDLLSQFDYLFERRAQVYNHFTAKVMRLDDDDGTAYVFSKEVEGCVETDSETWIIATPALWLRSAIKPNIGDNLLCVYFDNSSTYALYYGTDNDFETQAEPGNDVIYKNGAAKITINRASGNILAQRGNAEIQITSARASMKFGSCEIYCNNSGIFVTNGVLIFNLLTHLHQTGIGPTAPPTNGS